MSAPHSRACGIRRHDHGSECHSNCPTCGGQPVLVDHRSEEAQVISKALADQHKRMAEDIEEWAKGEEELGWPGDDVLKDPGNCDDLAAFLQDRGWTRVTGP